MTDSIAYQDPLYYRESGKFSAGKFPIAVIAATVGSVLGAYLYSLLDRHSPLIYLNVVMTLFFGIVAGGLLGTLLRVAKVRNRGLRIVTSLVLALVTFYAIWVFWIYGILDQRSERVIPNLLSVWRLAQYPTLIWDLAARINQVGAWSIAPHVGSSGGSLINGPILWSVWVIEAGIILVGFVVSAEKAGGEMPYCERCGCWAKAGKQLLTMKSMDVPTLRAQLEQRDFAPMLAQSPAGATDVTWQEAWTNSCDHCGDFNTLTVKEITQGTDRNGKTKVQTRIKISRLLISTVDFSALQNLREQLRAARALPIAADSSEPIEKPDGETEGDA